MQAPNLSIIEEEDEFDELYEETLQQKNAHHGVEKAYITEIERLTKELNLCNLKVKSQLMVQAALQDQREKFEEIISDLKTQLLMEKCENNKNRLVQYEKIDPADLAERYKTFESLIQKCLAKFKETGRFDRVDWFIHEARNQFNAHLGILIDQNEKNLDVELTINMLLTFDEYEKNMREIKRFLISNGPPSRPLNKPPSRTPASTSARPSTRPSSNPSVRPSTTLKSGPSATSSFRAAPRSLGKSAATPYSRPSFKTSNSPKIAVRAEGKLGRTKPAWRS